MGIKMVVIKEDRMAHLLPAISKEVQEEMLNVTLEIATELVPVDTGRLRSSIRIEDDSVVAETPYAGFVENGTVYMNAQPYLGPAVEAALEAMPMIVGDAFNQNMGG